MQKNAKECKRKQKIKRMQKKGKKEEASVLSIQENFTAVTFLHTPLTSTKLGKQVDSSNPFINLNSRNSEAKHRSHRISVGSYYTGCFFRMVPPQKVLSVEDGKIPTKKVKVDLSNSKMCCFNYDFHFFGRDF